MLQEENSITHFLVTALSTCSWDSRSSFMPTYTSLSNLSAEKKKKKRGGQEQAQKHLPLVLSPVHQN